jgi:cytochrome b pre-mRNA-processing protein 3
MIMFALFRKQQRHEIVARIYGEVLTQARQPSLFRDHGVPDTVEGRYDMMVLHLFLVLRRLAGADEAMRDAGQAICDHFFIEMDRALREMGVGDFSVPKRMKVIAEIYAGCSAAYSEALAAQDEMRLVAALSRNVYGDPTGADPRAVALAAYVRRADAALAAQPASEIIGKVIRFPSPALVDRSAA